jgi:hypothetical protein
MELKVYTKKRLTCSSNFDIALRDVLGHPKDFLSLGIYLLILVLFRKHVNVLQRLCLLIKHHTYGYLYVVLCFPYIWFYKITLPC